MPTSGSATFSGVAAYGDTPDVDAILADPTSLSQVEFNADFEDGNLTGRAYNFQSEDVDISGQLNISNGSIVDNTFEADFAGTLNEDGFNVAYDGVVGGGFLNSGDTPAGAMLGYGEGTATSVFGTYDVYGIFIAER
jgi:hypothetical protein